MQQNMGKSWRVIKCKILNTNFQGKKALKENSSYSLSIITLGSIIKVNKKYYPQIILDECKYEIKNKKVKNVINDD